MCRNYLLCSHPHGVLSAGAFCCFATEGTNFSEASCFIISMSVESCLLSFLFVHLSAALLLKEENFQRWAVSLSLWSIVGVCLFLVKIFFMFISIQFIWLICFLDCRDSLWVIKISFWRSSPGSRLTCLCWSKCFGSLSSETFGPLLDLLLPQRFGKNLIKLLTPPNTH